MGGFCRICKIYWGEDSVLVNKKEWGGGGGGFCPDTASTTILCFKHSILPFSSVLCLVCNEVLTFDMHVRVQSHPYIWILEGTQHDV